MTSAPGRPGPVGDPDEAWAVLRVRVVGPDEQQRRQLLQLLSGLPGIEVVGSADASTTTPDHGISVVLLGHDVDGDPLPGQDTRRPALSRRQREVLIAYSAGNDLLEVVARRIGMNGQTMKTHLRRIRAKYCEIGRPAPTRRDLYVRAVEDGLLRAPG
jgi:DNA-binding CsgD family transcriptional regulator